MPRFCVECEYGGDICDFCRHYAFNGDALGAYTGDGHCNKHNRHEDPEGGCEDFECFRGDTVGWATEPPKPPGGLRVATVYREKVLNGE